MKDLENLNNNNIEPHLIYGVGYLGKGEFKSSKNGKMTRCYKVWSAMLNRCYNEEYQATHKSYIGCTVCDEWYNFQNFAKWFYDNYYEIDGESMQLDKDILCKGNRVYSPQTCVFVPQRINLLFILSNKTRGDLPIGVSFDKSKNKYTSSCSDGNGHVVNLGLFYTPIEAWIQYKYIKQLHIRNVADEYKEFIPQKLYDAMYNYRVEIDD